MPFSTKYLFIVSMDVDPEKEALFNEVYDTEHVPYLSMVSGVRSPESRANPSRCSLAASASRNNTRRRVIRPSTK